MIRKAGDFIRTQPVGPVLYWQLNFETAIDAGSSYHGTSWRAVPEYQGGFLLDGGVHLTSLLRTVLPPSARPAALVGSAALHKAYLLPHDTITGMALPSTSSFRTPDGTQEQKATLVDAKIPGGVGVSKPCGTILLTWAMPNIAPESRPTQGLTVTCANAVVSITNVNRLWTFKVTPSQGTDIKGVQERSQANGVEVELNAIAKAIEAAKAGQPVPDDLGNPRGPLWDLAAIEALLTSNGRKIELAELI